MTAVDALVVTTLYPNRVQFRHGVFVETRIKQLKQSGKANITVIAPVPWFPVKCRLFPVYSKWVDVPRYENRYGIDVYHPRYIVIPKVGMLLTPFFLAITLVRQIKALQKQGHHFDLLDAHYYYPDGVAAAIVAKVSNLPLMITARGSDISLIADLALPRKMMGWASQVARFNLAVCDALRQRMRAIGMPEDSLAVLRNGVDLQLFSPGCREELRQKWQVQDKLLLSVGNLIELKGHHLLIEAMPQLPDYRLFIVGGGEWADKLEKLAERVGVADRVRFFGEIAQQQLPELYACADALVLASSREGWANVLLEAMACGTPVVATDIWGTPEVVQAPEAGVLCRERSADGIAEAIRRLFANYPERSKTRRYAEQFSWQETTTGLLERYAALVAER